tara:strand:+ start:4951 stop:6147 length:1197 start_codon:yes stop_codon:yes gene_type:complete
MALTASGSVSDYESADIEDLQQNIAAAAGVPSEYVTVEVTPGSVIITATITVPGNSTVGDVHNAVSTSMNTTESASTTLDIDVEDVQIYVESPSPFMPPPDPPPHAPPPPPPSPPLPPYMPVGSRQDPHLHLAHGGSADFRGEDGKWYALLSAPGVHAAARTRDSVFMLPTPLMVHGSFFTEVSFVLRGATGRAYGVRSNASIVGFDVYDLGEAGRNWANPQVVVHRRGVWTDLYIEDIGVYYKQATVVVRSNGWEVNSTRHPIYNRVSGDPEWRFDITMRMFSGGSGFETRYGTASKSCHPHGLIAQSYDGDDLAVDGNKDDYTYNQSRPIVTTRAQAEGAIEGQAKDYMTTHPFSTNFSHARFLARAKDACATRNVQLLTGRKWRRGAPPSVSGAE